MPASQNTNTVRPFDVQINRAQRISPVGGMIVESTDKEVGGGFVGSLDSVAWASGNSGAGSAVAVTSKALLTSGTANNGYGFIKSATMGRFHYASANLCRGTWRLPTNSIAGHQAQWGALNFGALPAIQDGFFFSYDGSTNTLSVNLANAGVITSIASGSFNGDIASYTLDNNAHKFEIVYQAFSAFFFVDNVLLHKFSPTTAQLSGNMALNASSISRNTGSGVLSGTLECWAQSIVRFGGVPPSPQFLNIAALGTTVIKLGPGTLQRIIINTTGSASNTFTIYDNTAGSGTKIGTVSGSGASSGSTLNYGCDFQNGLTIVSAAGTSADITVVYD